jgi:hypothetical protein
LGGKETFAEAMVNGKVAPKETFAEAMVNGKVAPKPAVPGIASGPQCEQLPTFAP